MPSHSIHTFRCGRKLPIDHKQKWHDDEVKELFTKKTSTTFDTNGSTNSAGIKRLKFRLEPRAALDRQTLVLLDTARIGPVTLQKMLVNRTPGTCLRIVMILLYRKKKRKKRVPAGKLTRGLRRARRSALH